MFRTSHPGNPGNMGATPQEKRWSMLLIGLIAVETLLVTLALIPGQIWTRILPDSSSAALNGPFPPAIAPFVTLLIYVTPTAIGFLCRTWQRALLFATLPAWAGLGIFVVAVTFRVGAFYLVAANQVTANVSVLELFAALGGIGWLIRYVFKFR